MRLRGGGSQHAQQRFATRAEKVRNTAHLRRWRFPSALPAILKCAASDSQVRCQRFSSAPLAILKCVASDSQVRHWRFSSVLPDHQKPRLFDLCWLVRKFSDRYAVPHKFECRDEPYNLSVRNNGRLATRGDATPTPTHAPTAA